MFTIEFTTDNAAFDESAAYEVAAVLDRLRYDIRSGGLYDGRTFKLYDSNGNHIGEARYTSAQEEKP